MSSWSSAAVILAVLLLGSAASAAEPMIITTASKQFVVRGKTQTSTFSKNDDGKVVYVDPPLLAMVCERVRTALRKEMGWTDRWRDNIFIDIYTASGRGDRAEIKVLSAGPRGWRYRIEMPDELNRRDVIQPIVEAMLLEYANRGARENPVELPPWLAEGMTEQLMHEALAGLAMQRHVLVGPGPGITLQPDVIRPVDSRADNSGKWLSKWAQEQGVLSVDQLSWPDFEENDQKAVEAYRVSSHLFVRELLRMKNGRECLSASLALLPEHLNWQGAFLLAFENHFNRMLDVEKWWSMSVVQTKSRDEALVWSAADSQTRLDEILYTPMQVRLTKNELPHITPVSLQTLISDCTFREQAPLLQGKMQQLMSLRQRMPLELVYVADEYRVAIQRYLTTRIGKNLANRDASTRAVKSLIKASVTELNAVDKRRQEVAKRLAEAETQKRDTKKVTVNQFSGVSTQ